jgi:hypothetical protein
MAAPMDEAVFPIEGEENNDVIHIIFFWMRLMNVVGQNRHRRALRMRRLAREHRARFLHHQEQQRMAILTLLLALQLVHRTCSTLDLG